MWEFVQNLTIVQWVLIGAGVYLVYPLLIKKEDTTPSPVIPDPKPQPVPKPTPQPIPEPDLIDSDDDLVVIVDAWSHLRSACRKAGLKEAEAKLVEVFPLLVKAEKIE